ncbi:MAG TPA: S9 family peptidase, partial [Tepidiformaceae bacterium]|nr:S9 family peptidase [Tepidiformaceae bacterium]
RFAPGPQQGGASRFRHNASTLEPPEPCVRAMTPDDLYNITWMGDCDISPDGSRVAYVSTNLDRESDSYRSAIWVVDTQGGAPRQFTAGAKRDSAPRWSPDGQWLAFLSERGEEKPQLALMPADGGESRLLSKLPFGAGPAVWSPDSTRIAFAAKTGTPPDPDPKKARPYRRISGLKYKLNGEGFVYDRRTHLFTLDIAAGGEPKQVTDGDWSDGQPAWSPGGTALAFVSARHADREYDTLSDVWVVASDGGEPRRLTETTGACASPSWSPDGLRLAYLFRAEAIGNFIPYWCSAEGTGHGPVDAEFDRQATASGGGNAPPAPRWLPGGSLMEVAEDRGAANPVLLGGSEGSRWLSQARRMVTAYSIDAAGRVAALVSSHSDRPAELSLLDMETGVEHVLARVNEEFLGEVETAAAERFVVETGPGVELDCWIVKPHGFDAGQTYPVLLNIHGGPFGQYGETFFDEFQVYAAAGYGVIFCNPRGSSGQSTDFSRAIVEHLGEVDYHDVMTAFEAAIERMPWADQSRLGVIGGSYGGFMTSWIIGHSQRFQAAVSERAVNDWYSMQGASDIGATFNTPYLGERALIQSDVEALLRASPLTYANDMHTPLLILHSEDDWRCPIVQAELLYVVLKQLRRDVEFVRFPDESHEMSRSGRPSHRVARFEVILDFFERKLQAGEPLPRSLSRLD